MGESVSCRSQRDLRRASCQVEYASVLGEVASNLGAALTVRWAVIHYRPVRFPSID
ncbi:MAG: hypothetical protein J6S41_00325 [Clostridia bacterium]|nr:hypothetical protein [Clostridia bacterium]